MLSCLVIAMLQILCNPLPQNDSFLKYLAQSIFLEDILNKNYASLTS